MTKDPSMWKYCSLDFNFLRKDNSLWTYCSHNRSFLHAKRKINKEKKRRKRTNCIQSCGHLMAEVSSTSVDVSSTRVDGECFFFYVMRCSYKSCTFVSTNM